ncbi:MAG: DOMON-like domain-containing protein [Deltaproteobacteria bacterium]|nr:DOMON-like domain-containing protein [Deltaproteobacteria bacterium]
MSGRNFSLQPFPPICPRLNFKITGHIARRSHQLAIRYDLRGDLAELVIPAPAAMPARRHGLWEETCCEFFLGVKDAPRYWEFNLSPAGHWNVYRFDGYRRGMAEETALTSLPVSVRRGSDSLEVALELDVEKIVATDQPLMVGIAAVIKLAGGRMTYWALIHPGPAADFHRRDSFLVQL